LQSPVPGSSPYGRWLELATGSKIRSTDRPELGHTSRKHHGGLTVPRIKTLLAKPKCARKVNTAPLEIAANF